MIDIINDIVARVAQVPLLGNRVYRENPPKSPTYPLAIVSRVSATPTATGSRGQELLTRCTYSIDVYGRGIKETDRIAAEAVDRLSALSMHRTGMTDCGIIADNDIRMLSVTVSGTVSSDGHTYRE